MKVAVDPGAVSAFWQFVLETSDRFVSEMVALGGAGETDAFQRACAHLQAIHPDLLLVVGSPDAARPELVVSAGGLKELFPVVEAVVSAAPEGVLRRYDVRAFRPRVGDPTSLRVRVKGRELGVADIRWDARRQRGDRTRCDLTVYVPGFVTSLPPDSIANRSTAESVFLLLDHVVGEWAVATQIGAIEWRSETDSEGLPTLVALPEYLERISAE